MIPSMEMQDGITMITSDITRHYFAPEFLKIAMHPQEMARFGRETADRIRFSSSSPTGASSATVLHTPAGVAKVHATPLAAAGRVAISWGGDFVRCVFWYVGHGLPDVKDIEFTPGAETEIRGAQTIYRYDPGRLAVEAKGPPVQPPPSGPYRSAGSFARRMRSRRGGGEAGGSKYSAGCILPPRLAEIDAGAWYAATARCLGVPGTYLTRHPGLVREFVDFVTTK